jgi:glycosyltransferase involved in cell wall biosynthesis
MMLEQHFDKRYTFFLCTRNRRSLLVDNFQRFRKLKKPGDELIVVDGGSKDGTVDLIRENLDLVDRYVSEPDRSEGEALNKALLIARGKYLKVLSDDDIFHEDAVEKAFEVMEAHPEVDVLVCGGTVGKEDGAPNEHSVPPGVNYGTSPGDVFDHYGNGLGLVIRHSSVCRTGIFSPTAFSLDWDFITQSIANGACVRFCRLNMCHHVIFGHSTSVAQSDRLRKDQARIARRYGRHDIAYVRDPRNGAERVLGFYYRYRRNLWKRMLAKLRGTPLERPPVEWDGGFS